MSRIDIAFFGGVSPSQIAECVKLAESLGYESGWVGMAAISLGIEKFNEQLIVGEPSLAAGAAAGADAATAGRAPGLDL